MMENDLNLKIQAYLDNELSSAEARQVSSAVARGGDAADLYHELKSVRQALKANEETPSLPESRDFYWSKIERGIRASEQPLVASTSPKAAPWWRFLAPVGITAALMGLLFVSGTFNTRGPGDFAEIETPTEEAAAITFHSQSARMTVVWVNADAN
jgi:hypothetical protein